MKQKKTILLLSVVLALLVVVGIVIFLCVGCDTTDTPHGSGHDTTTGDQITEGASEEEDTTASADAPDRESDAAETDGEEEPDESRAPSENATPDDPKDSTEPVTNAPDEPTESTTHAPDAEPEPLSYEAYQAMSAEEQEAHFNSFASPADFFAWYNAAKDKFLAENPGIEIGPDGSPIIP